MAVVTGPLHSSEARGQVGGVTGLVYNTHRGRAYVKANARPHTEYSYPQKAMRAHMVSVHDLWASLSDDARARWEDFARANHLCDWTGSLKRLSAWNWFARINFRLMMLDYSSQMTPPYPITSYIIRDLAVTPGTPNSTITWTPESPAPDPTWHLIFWACEPHPATQNPSFKLAKILSDTWEYNGTITIYTEITWTWTIYIQPLCANGITMPPTRLTFKVT